MCELGTARCTVGRCPGSNFWNGTENPWRACPRFDGLGCVPETQFAYRPKTASLPRMGGDPIAWWANTNCDSCHLPLRVPHCRSSPFSLGLVPPQSVHPSIAFCTPSRAPSLPRSTPIFHLPEITSSVVCHRAGQFSFPCVSLTCYLRLVLGTSLGRSEAHGNPLPVRVDLCSNASWCTSLPNGREGFLFFCYEDIYFLQ